MNRSEGLAGPGSARWSLQGQGGRRILAGLLIVVTACAASIVGVTNQYAQDDIPLIQDDPRVHSLAHPVPIWTGTYWPPPHDQYLYRPLATTSFALQWAVGGGSPVVFRLFSYALYAATAILVWLLARMLLPSAIALGVGLLFAAHPVHVEAVALGVNQSELWVGLIACAMALLYLKARQRGTPGRRTWLGLCTLYLAACLFKENALVIPGILMAGDALLIHDGGLARRVRALWRGYAAMIALGIGFLVVRTAVIGDAVGTFAAEAVAGQGIGGRILTMLQVVPEWLRLLVWPAHLRGDYSPAIINPATGWGWPQALGALILVGLVLIAWLLRRKAPATLFGFLWLAAAIFPVSNILVPTGIALAERTLFLPSVGFLLMAGGVGSVLGGPRQERHRIQMALATVTILFVVAGVVRSGLRHRDWRDHTWFWARTVERDAPLSYRAHLAFASILYSAGREARSIQHYHTAMALYPRGWWVHNQLANRFRLRGHCDPALELYAQSLRIEPGQSGARASRIACLLHLGRYDEAAAEADAALLRGKDTADFAEFRAVADSARRVGAAPGTVRLRMRETPSRW